MADDKLKPNPDVKWGKPNKGVAGSAADTLADYEASSLEAAKNTLELLKGKFGSSVLDERTFRDEVRVEIDKDTIPYVLEFLRDHPEMEYKYLSQVAAAEWHKNLNTPDRYFYITYDLLSFKLRTRFYVYAVLPRVKPVMPSVTKLYPTADWHEREIFDLFGVKFEGHPNLKRILLPRDFDGHPLLKDYPVEGKNVWAPGKNVVPEDLDKILDDFERGN
ncbi:NADH-quinone oxidoreductase subunit C [bacterium]|nr:NADH-quinone oxidoreductase subunit C [bacterium]